MSEVENGNNVKDIVEFKPELLKVIQDEETAKMVMDDLYHPILQVLRSGPMTVKEIEAEYNKIAKNQKSDKTIYRYLKTLQDADLIRAAGQRVIIGKTATETLFSRTAYAIYLKNEQAEYWKTEEGKRLADTLATALEPIVPDKSVNLEKFRKFLEDLSMARLEKLKEFLGKADKTLLEGISNYDWQRFTVFYNLGGLFAVLLSEPGFVEDLRNCFE